jgi:hypothetical protein
MVAIPPSPSPASVPAPAAPAPKADAHDLSFGDLLDVINPLQHIPIVSTIYRAITGDTMSSTAEIAGGALYGGLIGAVGSIADVLFKQMTGHDFGDTMMAWLGFGQGADTAFAKADTAPAAPAPPPAEKVPGLAALTTALRQRNFDPALMRQASLAYEQAIGVSTAAAAQVSAR